MHVEPGVYDPESLHDDNLGYPKQLYNADNVRICVRLEPRWWYGICERAIRLARRTQNKYACALQVVARDLDDFLDVYLFRGRTSDDYDSGRAKLSRN